MDLYLQAIVGLYRFLQEIYGNLPAVTHIEVDVEAMSGEGTPHLETIAVRVYSASSQQLLPDFTLSYRNRLTISDDGTVIQFLLLHSTVEQLPISVSTWITTIAASQRVREEMGRFMVTPENEEDLLSALHRLIGTILQVAALRCLLMTPEENC